MRDERLARVRSALGWLAADQAGAAEHAARIVALPPSQRDEYLLGTPGAATLHTLDALLDHAYRLLDRGPVEAGTVAVFVLRHVNGIEAPEEAAMIRLLVEARAWKERGNAFYHAGDPRAAVHAFQMAARLLAGEPAARLELAAVRRGEALARHAAGEQEVPRRMIRDETAVFEAHNDRAGVARSYIFEAGIDFDEGAHRHATLLLSKALAIVDELGDRVTAARIHNNLAHSLLQTGDSAGAVEHAIRALRLFEEHGMALDRLRAIGALAQTLVSDDGVVRALRALVPIRTEYLDRGLRVEAAFVGLTEVEMLVLSERFDEARALAQQLADVFAGAGMPREAMRAVAFVAAPGRGTMSVTRVRTATDFLHRLAADPDARFESPPQTSSS